jgi:hypothetical protein
MILDIKKELEGPRYSENLECYFHVYIKDTLSQSRYLLSRILLTFWNFLMAVEEFSHGVRIPNQQGQPKRLHRWLLAREC